MWHGCDKYFIWSRARAFWWELAGINDRAKYELIVPQKQLLKYNKETFGRFMQNLTRDHEKRIKENNQLRQEISKMKVQVQKMEKVIASIKVT